VIEGYKLIERDSEPERVLSPKLLALAESGFGVIGLFLILSFTIGTHEMINLTIIVMGVFCVIWFYFAFMALTSPSIERSSDVQSVNAFGLMLTVLGIMLPAITSPILGIMVILVGIMLILVSVFHPSNQIKNLEVNDV